MKFPLHGGSVSQLPQSLPTEEQQHLSQLHSPFKQQASGKKSEGYSKIYKVKETKQTARAKSLFRSQAAKNMSDLAFQNLNRAAENVTDLYAPTGFPL